MTRPVSALALPDVERAPIGDARPTFRDVDPRTLHVDDTYQRSLSRRSLTLITRIVSEWRWQAFKPPVCVETDTGLHVIDGQHTAIAAATHGSIPTIPVMVVPSVAAGERADAFVRHNRDRINVSAMELHFARLAAGDEDAQTVMQVCERAGVVVLRHPSSVGRYKPGETIAVPAIQKLIERRFAAGARRILEVAVKGRLAPIMADHIKAIEHLLFANEYKGHVNDDEIVTVLLAAHDLDADARRWSIEHKVSLWRALASCIFMRKGRRRG